MAKLLGRRPQVSRHRKSRRMPRSIRPNQVSTEASRSLREFTRRRGHQPGRIPDAGCGELRPPGPGDARPWQHDVKILAFGNEPGGLAIVDIDPTGGLEGGDAFNSESDMRSRLFRKRVLGAYRILTEPDSPVHAKASSNVTADEAIRIMATVLT